MCVYCGLLMGLSGRAVATNGTTTIDLHFLTVVEAVTVARENLEELGASPSTRGKRRHCEVADVVDDVG